MPGGSCLKGLARDWGTEQAERLALHVLQGEVWDRAVPACQQADARAYERAVYFLTQAYAAIGDFSRAAAVYYQQAPTLADEPGMRPL